MRYFVIYLAAINILTFCVYGADKRRGDDRQNYIIIYIHLPIPKGGKGSCNAMARLIHFHAYYITLFV